MNRYYTFFICFLHLFRTTFSETEYPKLEWIAATSFNPNKQYEQAGSDGSTPHYVARVDHASGQLVGFYDGTSKGIQVLLDGRSKNFQTNGQILVYPRGTVSWTIKNDQGDVPKNLLLGGFDPKDYEPIFICRAMVDEPRERKVYIGIFKETTKAYGCQVIKNGDPVWVDTRIEIASLSFLAIANGAGND